MALTETQLLDLLQEQIDAYLALDKEPPEKLLEYRAFLVQGSSEVGGGSSGESSPITASILALQTAATGANYAVFASTACTSLEIINLTGVDLEYRRSGAGETFPLPANSSRTVLGLTNANQIGVRRIDQSNTQVTVKAEAFS
jgi:hypothetical protein